MHTIQGYGSDFWTGGTSDSRQVVMGLLCPHLVAYFFSSEGHFMEVEARPWEYPAPRLSHNAPFQIHDAEFERSLGEQFAWWENELDFEAKPIQIQPFFDQERWVGTQEMADYLADANEDDETEELDEGEQAERAALIATGQFIFYWAKEYWLAPDGHVTGT